MVFWSGGGPAGPLQGAQLCACVEVEPWGSATPRVVGTWIVAPFFSAVPLSGARGSDMGGFEREQPWVEGRQTAGPWQAPLSGGWLLTNNTRSWPCLV